MELPKEINIGIKPTAGIELLCAVKVVLENVEPTEVPQVSADALHALKKAFENAVNALQPF